MRIFLRKMFWVIALAYLGYGAYMLLAQRSMIYYPNYPAKSDFYNCPAFEDSEKVVMDGTRAYYKHAGDVIVVVYHGNAGSSCDREHLKSAFESAGYSYLFVEYAGYGGDARTPSRELLFMDAEHAVSFLKTKNYKETVILAESIGAGVASYHASILAPNRMLFIAPFDSLVNVARSHFPFFLYPISLIVKLSNENYDNVSLLQKYKETLIIIHGTADRIVPLKRGKTLFDEATTPDKKFIAIEGAGHNDIYDFMETQKAISEFLP